MCNSLSERPKWQWASEEEYLLSLCKMKAKEWWIKLNKIRDYVIHLTTLSELKERDWKNE